MEVAIKYVIYELTYIDDFNQALQEVKLKGRSNKFNTEEEAILALVDDERTYNEYIILKEIYITK